MQARLFPAHGLQGAAVTAPLQQALGHVQHALAGAVALAQTADAQRGPEGAQALLALAAGATEAVDGLVGVADAEKAVAVLGQQGADQPQLHRRKVLHLVHQHMPPGQGRSPAGGHGIGSCRGGHHAQQRHLARYGAAFVRGLVTVGRHVRPGRSRGRGGRLCRAVLFRHGRSQQGPAGGRQQAVLQIWADVLALSGAQMEKEEFQQVGVVQQRALAAHGTGGLPVGHGGAQVVGELACGQSLFTGPLQAVPKAAQGLAFFAVLRVSGIHEQGLGRVFGQEQGRGQLALHHAPGQGMQGVAAGQGRRGRAIPGRGLQALPHLLRGAPGEGHGQQVRGRYAMGQQILQAAHQDARLARAGPGQHQHGRSRFQSGGQGLGLCRRKAGREN